MANKYQSNTRTYTARNLLWNHKAAQGPVPNGLFVLAPPANLAIDDSKTENQPTSPAVPDPDFVQQFFDSSPLAPKGGLGSEGWNPNSNIFVKKCGIFSNFADGLVFENLEGRVGLELQVGVFYVAQATGQVDFTAGSNLIVGHDFAPLTDFTTIFPLGWGYISSEPDVANGFSTRNMYSVYVIDGTNARISNYASETVTTAKVDALGLSVGNSVFRIPAIPAFNTLYDTEIFFRATNVVPGRNVFVTGRLYIDTADLKYNFYTATIDPVFTKQISMDALVEIDITPQ